MSNIDTSATKEIEAKHIYDQYFDLKKTLQKLTETLKKLADNQTIVLVVDELDRCLPEYSIKVLERLHHIFYDIPNIQVVLAIDKSQLENTVRKIFGENVSVKLYLDKFIDFELKLSAGKINQHFQRAYPTCFNRFTYDITPYPIVYEVCTMLLDGLEARVWNALIKKCTLCYQLLNSQECQYDASVLCIELFLCILKEYDLKTDMAKEYFDIYDIFSSREFFSRDCPAFSGLVTLGERVKPSSGHSQYFSSGNRDISVFICCNDIWGLLLGCYRTIIGFDNDIWTHAKYSNLCVGKDTLRDYILKYWKFIGMLS